MDKWLVWSVIRPQLNDEEQTDVFKEITQPCGCVWFGSIVTKTLLSETSTTVKVRHLVAEKEKYTFLGVFLFVFLFTVI